jgi:hypothetical protein
MKKYTAKQRKQYNQAYYAKNKEKLKADAKRYYYENQEKAIEKVQEYRDKNRPIIQEKGRTYYRRKLTNRLLNSARARAKKYKIDFNITEEDIFVPTHCPLLGIPLKVAQGKSSSKMHSPSLDRFDINKGYVKGNVWVISYKANTMKSDASLQELQNLVTNLQKHTDHNGDLLYNPSTGRMLEIQETI